MSGLNKVLFLYKCLQQVTACTIQKAESGKHVSSMPEETSSREGDNTFYNARNWRQNPPQHRRNSEKTITEIMFYRSCDISDSKQMFLPVNRESFTNLQAILTQQMRWPQYASHFNSYTAEMMTVIFGRKSLPLFIV